MGPWVREPRTERARLRPVLLSVAVALIVAGALIVGRQTVGDGGPAVVAPAPGPSAHAAAELARCREVRTRVGAEIEEVRRQHEARREADRARERALNERSEERAALAVKLEKRGRGRLRGEARQAAVRRYEELTVGARWCGNDDETERLVRRARAEYERLERLHAELEACAHVAP